MIIAIIALSGLLAATLLVLVYVSDQKNKLAEQLKQSNADLNTAIEDAKTDKALFEKQATELSDIKATNKALVQKEGTLRCKNETLCDKYNEAESVITEACLYLNNFKGNSKVVDTARTMLKEHIKGEKK